MFGGTAVDRMQSAIRQISDVFKLRIGLSITLCAFAGMAVTPGESLPAWKVAILVLAVFLSSAVAGAFNQYAERDLDARMPRTQKRPFVTGAFRTGWKWLTAFGVIAFLAIGSAAWVLNAHVALYVFLGAFVYGIVYGIMATIKGSAMLGQNPWPAYQTVRTTAVMAIVNVINCDFMFGMAGGIVILVFLNDPEVKAYIWSKGGQN